MTDRAEPLSPKRRFSWLRLVLVVSLAANLAVAGIFVGNAISWHREAPPPRALGLREIGYVPFVAALHRDERRALTRAFLAAAPRNTERETRRSQFEAILAALRADPYQPAALDAALAAHKSAFAARQDLGQQLLIQTIAAMDDAARRDYADRLDAGMRRPPRDRPAPR